MFLAPPASGIPCTDSVEILDQTPRDPVTVFLFLGRVGISCSVLALPLLKILMLLKILARDSTPLIGIHRQDPSEISCRGVTGCVCVCVGGFAAILLWDSAGLTGIDSDDGSKFFFQGSADGILVGIFRDSLRFSGIPEHSSRSSCQNPLGSLPKFPILLIFSLRFLKDSFGFLKMILCVTSHLLLLWRILVWMDPPCPWHYLRLIRIHVGFSQGSRRRR